MKYKLKISGGIYLNEFTVPEGYDEDGEFNPEEILDDADYKPPVWERLMTFKELEDFYKRSGPGSLNQQINATDEVFDETGRNLGGIAKFLESNS